MGRVRVGLVGIGNMGSAMAARLLEGGWTVGVRDIDARREATAAALGATVHATPAALAAQCDVLVIVVVDGAQTHDVLFGHEGAAAAMRPGSTVLLCPTIAPGDVLAAALSLGALGVACIDAPMSGGPARARAGTMSLMVACDDAAFEQSRDLLQALADPVFRVGTRPGEGARTKLVNNLLAAVNLAGAAEALALAARLGLDGRRTLEVIEASSGQSWIGGDRMRRALAGNATVHAHVGLLAKDAALALAMAAQSGVDLPLAAAARAAFADAVAAGLGDADDSVLYRLRLTGVTDESAGAA